MQKMKVGTCWHVSMWKSWTMKISIASPSAWGPSKKRSATPPGKQSYWCFFPWADLHNVRAFAKTASLTLIAATLANAWQEPCTILAIDWRVSREQEPCWRKPGKTRRNWTGKAWNPAEPSGTRRSGRTQRNPAEPGGNLAEFFFQNSFQLNCQLSTACLRGGGCLSSFALKSRSTQPTCPVQCAALDAGDL